MAAPVCLLTGGTSPHALFLARIPALSRLYLLHAGIDSLLCVLHGLLRLLNFLLLNRAGGGGRTCHFHAAARDACSRDQQENGFHARQYRRRRHALPWHNVSGKRRLVAAERARTIGLEARVHGDFLVVVGVRARRGAVKLSMIEITEVNRGPYAAHVDPAEEGLGLPVDQHQLGHAAKNLVADPVLVDHLEAEAILSAIGHVHTLQRPAEQESCPALWRSDKLSS